MKAKTNQEKGIQQNHNTAMMIVATNTVMTTGGDSTTAIVVNIKDVVITTSTLDTENVHTINTVITSTAIMKGAGTSIMVIGGPGINGIGTEDGTLKYKNMEDIIAKADI
jgi:hypothetical protein